MENKDKEYNYNVFFKTAFCKFRNSVTICEEVPLSSEVCSSVLQCLYADDTILYVVCFRAFGHFVSGVTKV